MMWIESLRPMVRCDLARGLRLLCPVGVVFPQYQFTPHIQASIRVGCR